MSNSLLEETKESLVENRQPIGKVIPGSPFIIVAMSYLGILASVVAVVGVVMWLIQ